MNLISLGFPLTHFVLGFGFCLGLISSFFLFGFLGFSIFIFLIYFEVIRIVPLIKRISNAVTGFFPEVVRHSERIVKKSFIWERGEAPVPTKPSIYLFHPHGAFSASFYFHTMTPFTQAFETNSSPSPVVHRKLTWLPFAKEILDELGCVFNKYDQMKETLKKGKSLALIPGGLAEMNCVKGGVMKLHLGDGIFKLASELKIPIIPVITFGENELYELEGSSSTSLLHRVQELCLKKLGIMLPIPTWVTFKKWLEFVENGLRNPVISYEGEPIFPEGDYKNVKIKYRDALEKFYAAKRPATYAEKIEFF